MKVDFFRSDSVLFITRRSRTVDHIDLCRINLKEGTVTELISEECKPHLNLTLFNYKILEGGKRFIWWSERTGYGNYYFYDRQGRLLHRIIKGNRMVAGNILSVVSTRQEIIFVGYGNEPDTNPSYTYIIRRNWKAVRRRFSLRATQMQP